MEIVTGSFKFGSSNAPCDINGNKLDPLVGNAAIPIITAADADLKVDVINLSTNALSANCPLFIQSGSEENEDLVNTFLGIISIPAPTWNGLTINPSTKGLDVIRIPSLQSDANGNKFLMLKKGSSIAAGITAELPAGKEILFYAQGEYVSL